MCIFSRQIVHVAKTQIFARGDGASQVLAYGMDLAASEDLAMILPLPMPPRSREDALRFIDLSTYPAFFTDLRRAFPEPMPRGLSFGMAPAPAPQLAVQRVGAFDASFVPSISDFERLDARFRLSDEIWRTLPAYADWGFAVFKLAAGGATKHVHPMAFEFPRRDPARLFFPTVHVHDGAVHEVAEFDHELYCQTPGDLGYEWQPSDRPILQYLDAKVLEPLRLVDASAGGYCRRMRGSLPNQDTWLDVLGRRST